MKYLLVVIIHINSHFDFQKVNRTTKSDRKFAENQAETLDFHFVLPEQRTCTFHRTCTYFGYFKYCMSLSNGLLP